MKLRTRQEILSIWRATLNYTYVDDAWVWGGRTGRNCVSDAEQLLTIIMPATTITSLRFDRPDLHTSDDVADALSALGTPFAIAEKLVDAMTEFHVLYRDADGEPVFSAGSYLVPSDDATDEATPQQAELDLVDSMSMSITLALGALTVARSMRQATANGATRT